MNNFKKFLITSITALFIILFIIFTDKVSESIVNSINVCINVIIPSMFAFMVISSYIVSSGMFEWLFAPIYKLLKNIIKLDKLQFSIFCLSLIGGYPVGIKLLKEVIAQNKNYYEIGSIMAAFCYCISPTFSITMIGLGLYNSFEAGMIIYISNLLSCSITAAVLSHVFNLRTDNVIMPEKSGLVNAISTSSSALFSVCSIIVVFNAGITAIEFLLDKFNLCLPGFINAVLEISNVLKISNPNVNILPIISAIASSGGICVMFQCASIAENVLSLKKFLIARIPVAVLSGLITSFLLKFWDIGIPAMSNRTGYEFGFNSGKAVLVLLLILCIILMKKSEKIFKKG